MGILIFSHRKFCEQVAFFSMRRDENLIALSRQHHQMLVMAQVLKSDVPAYNAMPKTSLEKFQFLKNKLSNLIVPNFHLHRYKLYPALIEWSFSDASLMDEIKGDEEEILISINSLSEADEATLNEIGISIEELVRKKERQLYQKIQIECGDKLSELDLG